LNKFLEKKKEPGCPTIDCSIGTQHFDHALCDLGASISVMPKVIFDKLNHTTLSPTSIYLQLGDHLIRHPAGVAENIPVKIRDFLVHVDFAVLDIEVDKKVPLILGRPFLSTAKAHIDFGAREMEKFNFKPKVEQCSMILATELAIIIALMHTKKKAKSKPQAKAKQIWKRKIVPPPKKASIAPQGGPDERT